MKKLIISGFVMAVVFAACHSSEKTVSFKVIRVNKDTLMAKRAHTLRKVGEIFVIKNHNLKEGDTLSMISTRDLSKVNVVNMGSFYPF